MEDLELYINISTNVENGRVNNVKKLVEQALKEGYPADDILELGLISAMNRVGLNFKNYRIFVPEVILASRALYAAMEILEPLLIKPTALLGKAVIGTIEGDYHDIGKSLVTIMLKSVGIDTFDIGINVTPESFLEHAEKYGADMICISASITTTMTNIPNVIKYLEKKNVRDKYIVLIGGAPVNEKYCQMIGADGYASNATLSSELAVKLLKQKKS